MPGNPRTQLPYDPIRADLVREVTAPVRQPPDVPARRASLTPTPPKPEPLPEPTITKRFVLTRDKASKGPVLQTTVRVNRSGMSELSFQLILIQLGHRDAVASGLQEEGGAAQAAHLGSLT